LILEDVLKKRETKYYNSVETLVDDIITKFDKKIAFGMPIALGKSYHIANEMYRRAKEDPSIDLTIVTALSLEKPAWTSDLERRMLEPIIERLWNGVPDFQYMLDMRRGELPSNVKMKEFYYKAGSVKNDPMAQQNHYSSNYTHVGRDIMNEDNNILYCHTVAKKEIDGKMCFSDSCNADLSLDIKHYRPQAEASGRKTLHVGHVNDSLPFMYGDAVCEEGDFDMILEGDGFHFPLFCVPKAPVTTPDHFVGLHVSTLIKDGGSLQIGIGSLGDAIASSLIMRHTKNDIYNEVLEQCGIRKNYNKLIMNVGGVETFDKGLYGTTEMLVDVFMELYRAGIIKRKVYGCSEIQRAVNDGWLEETLTFDTVKKILSMDRFNPVLKEKDFLTLQKFGILKDDLTYKNYSIVNGTKTFSADLRDEKNLDGFIENCMGQKLINGVIAHGGFFIGPASFYDALRNMDDDERKQFEMTGVAVLNQLYGNEELRSLQRKDARFVNAGMKISILGGICSDALENGTVISGVGGQYNFVSMGHALEGARVIMMIRAVRETPKGPESNIVFNYGYTTIPRHLKDIVVTEYGIADLRGKVDKDVVASLIQIADSRFQERLVRQAIAANKLPHDYKIPERYRNNYPDQLMKKLEPFRKMKCGLFEIFPFGTDFTPEEIILGRSLREFKARVARNKRTTIAGLVKHLFSPTPVKAVPYLRRMNLEKPGNIKEMIAKKIVSYALVSAKQI
jgi:acyl-CoA hydrolase